MRNGKMRPLECWEAGRQAVQVAGRTPILHYSVLQVCSVEQILGLLEEALAHGTLLAVAKRGELLKLRLLVGRQVGWHFDIDAYVQVAPAIALNILNALVLQAEHCARLGDGWNLDGACAVQRRDLDFRP